MSRQLTVLRALGLGDLLTSVPALRGLRQAFPTYRITLLAPAWLTPLALRTGAVDEVSPTPGLPGADAAALPGVEVPRGAGPDVAVNLHGRGPRSHRALQALRPARLMAFAHPAVPDVAGPRWHGFEHEVRRWCRLLAAYGIGADETDLALAPPTEPAPRPDRSPARPTEPVVPAATVASVPDGAVVIHPGAGAAARRWPADRFARVARVLRREGLPVVVTGSAAERGLSRWITGAAGLGASAGLAGRLTLLQLAELVARARLVICGDTGVGHLATAYGTPSVLLFGPTPPALWGPPPGRSRHTVLWAGRSGDPHAARTDRGLAEITTDEVIEAAGGLLTAATVQKGG